MAAITVRGIDEKLVAAIKRRAAERGRSMEEEVRALLAATYSEDRQREVKEWARRQLARLKRGELPKAKISSVKTIRAMREERDRQLMDAIEGRSRSGRHR